jgi:hypothetical protein
MIAGVIYALLDPLTREPRYIGQTRRGDRRGDQHRFPSCNTGSTHKERWVRSLCVAPILSVLEELSDPDMLDAAEMFWIAQARGLGWRLTNSSVGGSGNPQISHTTILQALARYTAGDSVARIARDVGVGEDALSLRMRAALGVPRLPRRPRRASNRISLDVPALLARYDAGESVLSLACAFGVSRLVVTRRLEENCITPRSGSEANRLRFARASPEERKALARAAQTALRGQRYRRGPDGKRVH